MKAVVLGKRSTFALTREGRSYYVSYAGGRRHATLVEVRLFRVLNIARIRASKVATDAR